MSGGGSGQPQMMFLPQQQQTSQTSQTQLPSWVNAASQANYQSAQNAAPILGQYYQGPMVADMNQGQMSNINSLNNNIGSYDPAFQSAQNTTQNLQNYNPNQINAQTYANGLQNIGQYMNPYINNVVNAAQAQGDYALKNNLNTLRDQAINSGAAYGSRQGVQEGAAAENAAYDTQQYIANALNQGYGQAANMLGSDINNNLQAQQANQNAGLQGANLNLNAANQMGNLASGQQQNFLNAINAAYTGNSALQNQEQNQITGAQQQLAAGQQAAIAPTQYLQSALANSPYGQTTTSNGTTSGFTSQAYQPTSSSLGSTLGGIGLMGLSALGNAYMPGGGNVLGGLLGGALGMKGNPTP